MCVCARVSVCACAPGIFDLSRAGWSDYSNSFVAGLPAFDVSRLPSLQNVFQPSL